MKQKIEAAVNTYREFFDYLDKVAEERNINVQNAPLKTYAQFIDFYQSLNEQINKEIRELADNFKIIDLLKKIPDREKLA
jgi:DNA-binding ferritin-like protein